MSHLPLALLASVFLIAPYALWHRRRLLHFSVPVSLGIGLAAVTWLPAVGLEPFRDAAHLYRGVDLTPEDWSLWNGDLASESKLVFRGLGLAVALPLLFLVLTTRDRWAILGAGVALIALGIVPLLWSLPLLNKVQFPWRSLAIAEFALATAFARRPEATFGLLLSLVPATVLTALLLWFLPTSPPQRLDVLLHRHPDVYEMLPKGAINSPRRGLTPSAPELTAGAFRPRRFRA